MLLNHKDALDFIIESPDYLHPLSVSKIEDIHSILVKELDVEKTCIQPFMDGNKRTARIVGNAFL